MSGPMIWWLERLKTLAGAGEPTVLVTVAAAFGSSPRKAHTRMIVTEGKLYGTIGGGNLEYRATAEARDMLSADSGDICALREYPLGPALGQCCGGYVKLHYEKIEGDGWLGTALAAGPEAALVTDTASPLAARRVVTRDGAGDAAVRAWLIEGGDAPDLGKHVSVERLADTRPLVMLYGAGHVGRALAQMLAAAACRVRLVDDRPDLLTGLDGIEAVTADDPVVEAASAPTGAAHLVMTHSHRMDEDICTAVLKRGDFAFLGLIGSGTKKARFEARFREAGITEATIARLTCPIGIDGIGSRQPGAIAVATAAQVLRELEAMRGRLEESRDAEERA